jgi:hypothetical protein
VQVKKYVQKTRRDSANQVEEEVREVAKEVFDVVTKYPQEKHVAGDVRKARVEKHAGQERKKGGFKIYVPGEPSRNACGNGGVGRHKHLESLLRKRELIQEHRDIGKNEQSIYDRVATPGVQVFEWYEHAPGPGASALREALTGQQSNGKGKKGKAEWKRCRGSIPESCGRILKSLTERLQGAAVYGI